MCEVLSQFAFQLARRIQPGLQTIEKPLVTLPVLLACNLQISIKLIEEPFHVNSSIAMKSAIAPLAFESRHLGYRPIRFRLSQRGHSFLPPVPRR